MLLDGVNHIAWISNDAERLKAFYARVFDADVRPQPGPRRQARRNDDGDPNAILGTAVKDRLLQSNPCQIDGATQPSGWSQSVILEIDDLAALPI